jgi:hypothetical protein
MDAGKANDALLDRHDMLHLCPDLRLAAVTRLGRFIELLIAPALPVGEFLHRGRRLADDLSLAGIGPIPPDACLLPVQQVFQYLRVVRIGGGGYHRVNLSAFAIRPSMDLHS